MHVPTRALPPPSTISNGAFAGLAGATALALFEALIERRWLGRDPVYSSRNILERALPRVARRGGAPRRLALGVAARSAYAVALGLGFAALRARFPRSSASSAALFAAAISGAELVLLPRLGLVPPVSRWSREEALFYFAHVAVYAVAMAKVLDRMDRPTAFGPVIRPARRNALRRLGA